MNSTVKQGNETIYYTVDMIHTAIQEKRQIAFRYIEYTPSKEKVLKHSGYRYVLSPYALIWSQDYYYIVGWSEKHQKLAQFRVDRMVSVEILEQQAVPVQEHDPAAYVQTVFGMYGGRPQTVELLCENHTMRSIIDHFGEDVQTTMADRAHFRATVEVTPSPPFYGWVFTFGGSIQIMSPEEVVSKMREMCGRFQ